MSSFNRTRDGDGDSPRPQTPSCNLPCLEMMEERILLSLLGQTLFPADNAWNQRVDQAPVAASSAGVMSNIVAKYGDGQLHPDFGQDIQSSSGLFGLPYNVVHGNSTPKVHIAIDDYPAESDLIDSPIPANAVIEGDYQNGPRVGVANRGDSHLLVWDEDNNIAYEFFYASRPSENADGKWHAASEAVWDMKTNSFRTLNYTSADAAGLSILAGLARPDEGLPVSEGGQGVINHAIRFTLKSDIVLGQFIYPASHEANSNTNPAINPPMGSRFRLKSSVDISGLSPEARVVAQAMKDYGLILTDSGGNFFLGGSSYSVDANNNFTATWNNADIQDSVHGLKSLHYSDFEMVDLTPIVTGLSATTGSAGTQVTVTGKNFSGAAGRLGVLFGNTPGTSVRVIDDSHVTAIAPAGTGTVDVRVQSGISDPNDSKNINSPIFGYGVSAVTSADRFTYGTVVANSATHFGVSAPASAIAGAGFSITVTALDAGNLTAGSYLGTVHFAGTDPQGLLPTDYVFTSSDQGVHTFNVTLKTAGTHTITATDTYSATIKGVTGSIVVSPAAASRLTLSAPSTATAGATFSATVTAYDPYGNLATGYTGTVHFTSTDPSATLPGDYTFYATDKGTHTFAGISFGTVGADALTVVDLLAPSVTATASVQVSAAPALAAPSLLTATTMSKTSIKLTWQDNATSETGLRIERSLDGVNWSQIAILGMNVTTYTDTGLTRHRKYYYRVRAVNTGTVPTTYSSYSNTASATTR